MLGSKTWHDRIINKIDADIFEPKTIKNEPTDDSAKQEGKPDVPNGSVLLQISVKEEVIENDENKAVTLEEQAAKEIIEDLNSKEKEQQSETKTLTLPLTEDPSLRGTEQVFFFFHYFTIYTFIHHMLCATNKYSVVLVYIRRL